MPLDCKGFCQSYWSIHEERHILMVYIEDTSCFNSLHCVECIGCLKLYEGFPLRHKSGSFVLLAVSKHEPTAFSFHILYNCVAHSDLYCAIGIDKATLFCGSSNIDGYIIYFYYTVHYIYPCAILERFHLAYGRNTTINAGCARCYLYLSIFNVCLDGGIVPDVVPIGFHRLHVIHISF